MKRNKIKYIYSFIYAICIVLLGTSIVYAAISWPTTPDGETAGWSIGTLLTTFTIDSWNVWIGKTPTTKLDVNGTISATNIAGSLTTASQPNITTLWTLSTLTVTWDSIFDTTTLFVDSTNNRVWIGTITPWVDLDVNDTDTSHIRAIITGQTNNPSIYMLADEANNKWWIYSTAPKLELGANNSIHMTILSTWDVGIGTASPTEKLDVAWSIKFWSTNSDWLKWWNIDIDSWLLKADSSTHSISVMNSGKVGIGTTTPGEKLDVVGNVSATTFVWDAINFNKQSNDPSVTVGNWKLYYRKDIYDSYTKLLLHMDWSNGATNFVDSSNSAHTINVQGWAQMSNISKKFGDTSWYFPNDGDFLEIPNSDDFNFWNWDFTVDLWMKATGSQWGWRGLLNFEKEGETRAWSIRTNGDIARTILYHSSTVSEMSYGTSDVNDGNWHHIAYVRSGNVFYLFVDGVAEDSDDFGNVTINSRSQSLYVSRGFPTVSTEYFNGNLDEVRVSKWVARWTNNFTPPTRDYNVGGLVFKDEGGTVTPMGGWGGGWWGWAGSLWGQSSSDLYYDSGNIWIGTTTPSTSLEVAGTTKTQDLEITWVWYDMLTPSWWTNHGVKCRRVGDWVEFRWYYDSTMANHNGWSLGVWIILPPQCYPDIDTDMSSIWCHGVSAPYNYNCLIRFTTTWYAYGYTSANVANFFFNGVRMWFGE